MLKQNRRSVTAFAPATTANVAVGFDILGFACDHLGDTVTLTLRDDKKVVIDSIESTHLLPMDPDKNTASVVVKKMITDLGLPNGFTLTIKKGIPLSSGLGGSAASAVAAAVACNDFLSTPLSKQQLVEYALSGEWVASGARHADNIAPCVYGGLTLVRSSDPLDIISLPIPDIYCVLIHPHLQVNTKDARQLLLETVSLHDYINQSACLASFIVSLYEKNNVLLKQSLQDHLIEPQRAKLIPEFYTLKKMAMDAGALGMSLSGSGPTLFAWMTNKAHALTLAHTLCAHLAAHNLQAESWVSQINRQGACVIEQQ